MPRHVLSEEKIAPPIREKIAGNHRDVVEEVMAAVAAHDVVVVGMKQNPHCARVRKALRKKGVRYEYLEYGSYTSLWRRRNALKMWTGWPTFPMVFHKGTLVGGADEVEALLASGEIA
jgi:glutaredoxin-related protein